MAKVSAQQVYNVMKGRTDLLLTEQQRNAVELASVTTPELVVAGAGSGKTELMAVRVLWLVANGYARPEQILGLTFTRKAASELAKRIHDSLKTLKQGDLWPFPAEEEVGQATVTTYNSYANALFRENALALGYEAESNLITEAAAFQLARELIVNNGGDIDPRLLDNESSLKSLVEGTLKLAAEMNDNLVGAQQIREVSAPIIAELRSLPTSRGKSEFTGDTIKLLARLENTDVLATLAEAYLEAKKLQGYVDYSDQVVLAERATRENAEMVLQERERFSQILLDEYQDTSYLQTRLLSQLFAKKAVLAVGDPNQSIYGWRGASASNLANFAHDFEVENPESFKPFELSTSWRNPSLVLDLANRLAEPLVTAPAYAPSAPHLVPTQLRSRDGAQKGGVEIVFEQDIRAEAKAVAKWFKRHFDATEAAPTAALLMRAKKHMPVFAEALYEEGIEPEIVGLGGLLEMPEIIDLVAALKVIHDPSRGSELLRLLTGARWRIGIKDVDMLYRYASMQNRFDKKVEGSAPEDNLSLIDALDLLREPFHQENCGVSEVALPRLVDAAELFAHLRRQTGLPLPEFIRLVERELWLDIEVCANPLRRNPMANLNGFANLVSGYAASNHRPYLGALLNWIDTVEERERVDPPTSASAPGVVQILTVHSAKGLEWDLVSVSGLQADGFPSYGKDQMGWLKAEVLPYSLRGDAVSLPVVKWKGHPNQTRFHEAIEEFKREVKEHKLREETRLIYVAVTRPKQNLLLSGAHWKPAVVKANGPSEFIVEAARFLGLEDRIVPIVSPDVNPLEVEETTNQWPLDPLGPKHAKDVRGAADLVHHYLNQHAAAGQPDEIDLLLGERDEMLRQLDEVPLTVRINASGFKNYVTAPAKTAAGILRPVPEQPFKATRAGTIFHNLMEQRYADVVRVASEAPDIDLQEVGEQVWAQQLTQVNLADHAATVAEFQATFEKTKWASMLPEAIEIEIQLAIGANIFICKLDAVFPNGTAPDGSPLYEVVDWKTGVAPKDKQEVAERSLQLALYRLAFAELRGLPIENISACLYYVTDDQTVTPDHLLGREEILELWAAVAEAKP